MRNALISVSYQKQRKLMRNALHGILLCILPSNYRFSSLFPVFKSHFTQVLLLKHFSGKRFIPSIMYLALQVLMMFQSQVGLFPDVIERKILRHFEEGDLVRLLYIRY